MAEVKKKKWRWYAKITSREDALDAVKGSSRALFVVGAIPVAVSFLLGFSILFDALKHFLSLIVLWAAILAVEATFKLRSRFALEPLPVEPSKA